MPHDWLEAYPYAHRGLHGPRTGHVENSLSAFKEAVDQGFGFELDVLLSSDNIAVVIHDHNLSPLTTQKGEVINYKAKELSRIQLVGSTETIPTLKEVLNQTNGRQPILIEIKGDQDQYNEISRAVWKDIENYKGDVAIMSFYPEIIKYFRNNHPSVTCGLVATSLNDGNLPSTYFDPSHQKKVIKELETDFIAYDIRALPNIVTKYCCLNNIPVLTWTVCNCNDQDKAYKNSDNIIFEHH